MTGKLDSYQIRKRYIHKDGHEIWALLTAAAIRDDDGNVLVYVSQIVDISEAIEHEREIESQRNEYQSLTENVTDVISQHDAKGTYLYVNSACTKLLGYQPEEMIGTSAYKYFHPDDINHLKTYHKRIRKNEDLFKEPVDYRIQRKDGSYIWVQSRTSGIFEGSHLVKIIAVTRDMDVMKKTLADIEDKEERYRLLLDNLPLRVFYKDTNSVYQGCNALYAHDLGIKADSIIGKTDDDFYPKELVRKYHHGDQMVVKNGQRFESIEDYLIQKRSVRVHTIKIPINENNKTIGIMGIFWDISQEDVLQKENHQTIKKLEKMNRFFTNRELKMIELKKENAELRRKLEGRS